ncbi:MAG: LAGLIDADG family homing endonuclease [Nanoarchaeota archaeon]
MESVLPKKKKQEEMLLEAKNFFNAYKKEISQSIRTGERVIYIPFQHLAEHSPSLSEEVLENPQQTFAVLENALDDSGLGKNIRVRITDLPKSVAIKIREIRSKHLDQMLWIEGIIRQASDVRPQVVNAKFECPNCGALLSVLQIDNKFREPSRCTCGWKSAFRLISKEMVDTQRLVIEESPDSLEGGEQPRRINVFLQEDLVDPKMEERTTPGSKVKIFGVLKEVPIPLKTGSISTRYDIAIEANNIIPLEETFEDLNIDEEAIEQILELAADPNVYYKLSSSIAPSIYGFERIKEAVLLELFGGVKKLKSDGGSSRGDIHILLVGDPGVAKSVMLKFISAIAPKGRYVSGKAATAAGLTAAVIKDEFLRGWSLEAGAMVLANKGTVCIDEIEKMTEQDRSTMHEAMEQQCYHHDTVITLADGSEVKIGEIVEKLLQENKEKIIEGKDCFILPYNQLEVLTTDFKTINKTKINRISKHKAFDKFIKIKFSHGREIIVTPEHPVFTVKDGKISTKRADEMIIGDPIPIPLYSPIEGKEQLFLPQQINERAKIHINIPVKNGPELFKIIGYFIAEGSREINRKKFIGINFVNKDVRVLNDFNQLMKNTFNIAPYKQARIDHYGTRWSYRYTSTELASFLKETSPEILKLSGEKQIPLWAMKGKSEDIAKMLSALFEGDGYVSKKERTIRIGYKTKSKRLAEQIQDLLLRFRIRSSITADREYFRVGITDYDNILSFQKYIGFVTEEKNEIISYYIQNKKIKRQIKNVIPKQFNNRIIEILKEEKIESIGKYKIYNIISDHQKRKNIFGFSRSLLKKAFPKIKKEENKEYLRQFTEDIGWERVSGIEIIKNEDENWVYDVTIEPNHSFISQAAILHNTITVSKANIHATLRAETTVLAAGNPKLGRFNPYVPIPEQIDISPALLSRFDVIFVIKDMPNKVQDEAIATHVLEEHKQEVVRDTINPKLLRKYISYAKRKFKPKLTDEAIEEIKNFYVKLRGQSTGSESTIKPIAITARQLEGIIRLSEAHAKMHLRNEVKREDAIKAIELLKVSLTQVGYDEETKTYDIDRITSGISAGKRSKILVVRETIAQLESRLGKLIPIEELEKAIEGKMTPIELEDSLSQLSKSGDIFKPRKGFIQKI